MGGYLLDALVGHGPLGEGPLVSPLSSEEVAGLGFERVVGSAPVSIVEVAGARGEPVD